MVGEPTMSRPLQGSFGEQVPTNLSNTSQGSHTKTPATRTLLKYAGALIIPVVLGTATTAMTRDKNSVAPATSSDKIAPWLAQQLQSEGKFDVFVVMRASADLSAATGFKSRGARGRFVYDTLRGQAEVQKPLVEWLRSKGYDVTRFWIVNAVLVRQADAAVIEELSHRGDVGRLVGNPLVNGLVGSSMSTIPISTAIETVLKFPSDSLTSSNVPATLAEDFSSTEGGDRRSYCKENG